MLIFPAIDIYEGRAVRLLRGDFGNMTVYSNDPVRVAEDFRALGAEWIHIVYLEGAKNDSNPNFATASRIKTETGLRCEIGGGIRSLSAIEKYISAGFDRVILGTVATDPGFIKEAVRQFGSGIAVGVDARDGKVATHGWTRDSGEDYLEFCKRLSDLGIGTIIATNISRDGAMMGVDTEFFRMLSENVTAEITASGGVSSIDDVRKLRELGLYGAIVGKAYYTGSVDLKEAIEAAI